MEKIKQFWKKIPKAGKICIGVFILFLFCITYLVSQSTPLDQIRLYEVNVKPLEDGTLEIRYHLNWEVKNDKRKGPFLNVRIGMANNSYELTDAGGDLLKEQRWNYVDRESGDVIMIFGEDGKVTFANERNPELEEKYDRVAVGDGSALSRTSYDKIVTEDGHLIEFELRKSFYKGEIADFWFTVHQERMLCKGSTDVFYDFTPGWFEDSPIDHYRFTWEEAQNVRDSNADRTEEDLLIWEGEMEYGGHRTMRVSYDADIFRDAETVIWRSNIEFPKEQDESQYRLGQMKRLSFHLVKFLIYLLMVGFLIIRAYLSYKEGEGFHGRRRRGGTGGGGGGCACAGCACACACAGGGRAGCSRKDFHTDSEKIPCTLWKKVL